MSAGANRADSASKGGSYSYAIKSALFGVAVGDALGVPVEFKTREYLDSHPVADMTGFGTHKQPPGTWSDDSSLTFCLAEALTQGYDLNAIGQNFVNWYFRDHWTAREEVFDVGTGTGEAIVRLFRGIQPERSGDTAESSNGNGSLMRILPLLFWLLPKPLTERFEITRQVSSITHGHIRSIIACFYYLEFARLILEGREKFDIYRDLQQVVSGHLSALLIDPAEVVVFDRLLKFDIHRLTKSEIRSGGYVIDTLEAAIWCLLTTGSYSEAVLRAVNLGQDTDTTAAVTGGLAGLLYGYDSIPEEWITQIARKDDITELAERLAQSL
ncbi:MAG TPA: ADP-ribosylglycohydrolase family protein [Bacteroidales bacterium]|nr:ADP-ribosylglycohydrolase family protein [Bacteroidales bacterium]